MTTSNIRINGHEFKKEEALRLIESAKKISRMTVEMNNPKERGELTDEGFAIDQAYTASICRNMREMNASYAKITLSNSRKIMGMNCAIIMYEPNHRSLWKRTLIKILEKLL